MISSAVVTRYANALADVVLSPSSDVNPQDAARQLRAITETVEGSSDLRAVLASPAVPVARKRVVLKDIAGKLGTSRTVRNFILVLSDHRRMTALVQVLATVENIFDERAGFIRGDVKSAVDLSAAQQGELSGQLSTIAGQPVRLHFSIDPALIGGVTAKIGSKVYDGSVRGQLAEMSKRLSAKA
jgi:F-type H+-transporting ATPase subunit delta